MQSLFDYILKLSISLSVVYMFYQLVLRKLTFYNWNRWYLLGYTAFAFLIPLMDITKALNSNEWNQRVILHYIPVIELHESASGAPVTPTWTAFDWLFLLLLAGMLVLVIKFVIRYLSFLKVRRGAILLADGDTKLFMVEKDIIPFSFGNNIFINNRLQDEAELKEIIRHEFVHVKEKHTHDIIWSELLCILNWYNPFVWLIRKAIRQNLEFIADNNVLEQGFDKKKYQYLLLKVTGNNHFSIANQFNFSSLKKRIAMMNKMKSARAQLIKFLFIVPLIAVMLLAFRNEKDNKDHNPFYRPGQDFTDSIPAELPPPPPPPARPPVPPVPPVAPNIPGPVKSLNITENEATVILKDGTVEKYDFKSQKDRSAFHERYGKFLSPPPPPPPPPHGVSIAPGAVYELDPEQGVTIAVGVDRNTPISVTGQAKTITSVNAPVILTGQAKTITSVNAPAIVTGEGKTITHVATPVNVDGRIYNVTAITPINSQANIHGVTVTSLTPVNATLNEVVTTGYPVKAVVTANDPAGVIVPPGATVTGLSEVAVEGRTVSRTRAMGEKLLELRISKYTSQEKLDQLIAEARSKDVEVKFDNIEYDNNGKLARLAGKIEKGDSKTNFSVSDFEVVILSVTKINGKYNCSIGLSKEKEVQ